VAKYEAKSSGAAAAKWQQASVGSNR